MTEKEAIKVIEIAIAEVEWDYPLDYTVAFKTAIKALEEIQYYREMDRKLWETYGDCIGFLKTAAEASIGNPIKARLLTNEDADRWDAYRKLGTVEECREAIGKQTREKVTAESEVIYNIKWECPKCGSGLTDTDVLAGHCKWCGKAVYHQEPPNGQ